jgi:hypothetical protein
MDVAKDICIPVAGRAWQVNRVVVRQCGPAETAISAGY